MARLHQVIRFMALAVVGVATQYAADYCSLRVRVLSPDQKRLLEVPVSVRERTGRVTRLDTTSDDLGFCDLGIVPVTVTVGLHSCNQVVVNDVPLLFGEDYLLTVMYDPEPCEPELPPAPIPVCEVLLRVAGVEGRWINGASVEFQTRELSPRQTDAAGRSLLTLRLNQQVSGVIRASGYTPLAFSVTCSRQSKLQEKTLNLQKSGAR